MASLEEQIAAGLRYLLSNMLPLDLSGLHAVTATGQQVLAQFQTLTPATTTKDIAMTSGQPTNPQQGAVDADVAALTAVFTGLGQVFTDIKTELGTLPADVDTTALDALVKTGQDALAQFQTLDTVTPPTPDPTPAPDPTPTPDPDSPTP